MELIDIPPGRQVRNLQLDMLRDDLDGVRGEIASLIGHIEGLREDLYGGDRGFRIRSICCCCRRRDLRKLEDRLWIRLHQLQEKENEIHRQRTAILSRLLLPDGAEEGKSPAPRQPPPVSPELPESPRSPWRPDRRQLASTSTAEDHALPPRMVSDLPLPRVVSDAPHRTVPDASHRMLSHSPPRRMVADAHPRMVSDVLPPRMISDSALFQPSVQAQQRATPVVPVPSAAQRGQTLRRRPSRPGSAEDTGSGAE